MRLIRLCRRVQPGLHATIILTLALAGLAAAPAPQTVPVAPSTPAVNFTVTRTDDPAPSGCGAGDCSLREAIINANTTAALDTILLPAGTYTLTRAGEDASSSADDLDITHSLIISVTGGLSATLTASAAHNDRILQVLGAGTAVTLTHLIIQNGETLTNTAGGGLRVESGSTLTLQDVLVRNNSADGNAGGILNIGTLHLISSTVFNNIANGVDGGGGLFNDDNATLTMTGGGVISNSVGNAGGGGAGLYLDTGGSATLTSVQVLSNTAGAGGAGGGLTTQNGSTTHLINVVLAGNNGGSSGGGVFNDGVLQADGTLFFNNRAGSGGAILNRVQASLTSSQVISNSATNNGGGGIDNLISAFLTMSHTSVLSNSAGLFNGGGLENGATGQVVLTDTVFANNLAGQGAGIDNLGKVSLTGGELRANRAITSGGGLRNDGSTTLNVTDVISNSSLGLGGGIDNDSGSRLAITGGQMISNSAFSSGGAVFVDFSSSLVVSGTLLAHNQASSGGALFVTGTGIVTATNSVLSDNQANIGGGISSAGFVNLTASALVNNRAVTVGGGGAINSTGSLSATNTTLSGNIAQGQGGGIFASGKLRLNNVTIAGNQSVASHGGGLRSTATGAIFNTLIAGNTALANPDCDGLLPSLDYNLVEDATGCSFLGATSHTLTNTAAVLGGLTVFGGTLAVPPLSGSPALNAGNDATCAPTDQRGVGRPVGAHCDIGAFEGIGLRFLFLPLLQR